MKKIGIIGGLGPEATVEYYKQLIRAFDSGKGDLIYPEMIIYSVNMGELMGIMRAKQYDRLVALLLEKIESLRLAGAGFAAMTANTPHVVFDQLKEKSPIPLISIVEAACRECLRLGLKRAGLIGTGFTMNATFYQEVFNRSGIEVVTPNPEDKQLIHEKLFSEIELGIFKDETRNDMIGIIEKMVRNDRIDSMILGCTEFPLILTEPEYAGIPMIDTTKVHVNAIVKYCLE
jgi:aspartate racemase